MPRFGHPNTGIFGIKIRNKNVDNYYSRLTLQCTNYRSRCVSMQSSIHYFGLLLDYLELLCFVSFQQSEPENEGNIT